MGILKQQEEIYNRLHFYWTTGGTKEMLAWINDIDGSLRVDSAKLDTIEQSKALCQWYLSVCDEL
jgi:hypothetical protein